MKTFNSMETWERNNIFRSYNAEDCFKYDILEKIMNDYMEDMDHKNKEVTRENLEDVIMDMLEAIMGDVDIFLDEEF